MRQQAGQQEGLYLAVGQRLFARRKDFGNRDAEAVPEPVREFAEVFTRHDLAEAEIGHLEREAFYERARAAFAVVRTGELRPYGNILLVKGVVHAYPPVRS